MAKILDTIKLNEAMQKQFNLTQKILAPAFAEVKLSAFENLHIVNESLGAVSDIFFTCTNVANRFHEIYGSPILTTINSLEDFFPKCDLLFNDIIESINSINLDECSDDDSSILTESSSEILEIKETIDSKDKKSLTWEQWFVIFNTIIGVITFIKSFLPDKQIEVLTNQFISAYISFENYSHQSLDNQELFLEKQDEMIKNQEELINLLQDPQQTDTQVD